VALGKRNTLNEDAKVGLHRERLVSKPPPAQLKQAVLTFWILFYEII
jgi:hypothetical protein